VRLVVALAAVGGLVAAGLGSLSDRVPLAIRSVQRRAHNRGWLPWYIGDPTLHVFGWLAITLLVTLAVREVRARVIAAGAIVGIGVAIEILQPMFSLSRRFQAGDVVANVVGVAIGLALGLVIGKATDRR
jgi:hypothetical protein